MEKQTKTIKVVQEKEVEFFTAFDGRCFDNAEKCKTYEKEITKFNNMKTFFSESFSETGINWYFIESVEDMETLIYFYGKVLGSDTTSLVYNKQELGWIGVDRYYDSNRSEFRLKFYSLKELEISLSVLKNQLKKVEE